MRVLVASTGGAGHVTPMMPVAAACRQAGHELLLVGPPELAAVAARNGLAFTAGALPTEAETEPIWARVPGLPYAEAERLVISQIFATGRSPTCSPTPPPGWWRVASRTRSSGCRRSRMPWP
jgi:hypothetical protein